MDAVDPTHTPDEAKQAYVRHCMLDGKPHAANI